MFPVPLSKYTQLNRYVATRGTALLGLDFERWDTKYLRLR